jgi:hypothetical protein
MVKSCTAAVFATQPTPKLPRQHHVIGAFHARNQQQYDVLEIRFGRDGPGEQSDPSAAKGRYGSSSMPRDCAMPEITIVSFNEVLPSLQLLASKLE